MTNKTATGVERIANERRRQLDVLGWNDEHDDEHVDEELAHAAAYYAIPVTARSGDMWPWRSPPPPSGDRIHELEKAGALIAAEIDRLTRRQRQVWQRVQDAALRAGIADGRRLSEETCRRLATLLNLKDEP